MNLQDYADAYARACAKVVAIEERINEHAAKREHKKKNKIINDEWRRACLARNKARTALLSHAEHC